MRRIMVANPKGGSGKSTLAVHLASWFARNDELVRLGEGVERLEALLRMAQGQNSGLERA